MKRMWDLWNLWYPTSSISVYNTNTTQWDVRMSGGRNHNLHLRLGTKPHVQLGHWRCFSVKAADLRGSRFPKLENLDPPWLKSSPRDCCKIPIDQQILKYTNIITIIIFCNDLQYIASSNLLTQSQCYKTKWFQSNTLIWRVHEVQPSYKYSSKSYILTHT